MKINQEKLRQYGYNFKSLEGMYLYIRSLVEYLESHNENYTMSQRYLVQIIANLMECIEI